MGRTRQQQQNAATKKAILDTAVAIGLEEGFSEISVRKITDKLGYSASSVYHYFKDKQEILDTIHEMKSRELMEQVSTHLNPEKSFADNCKTVFNVLCEISLRDEDMIRTILYGGTSRTDNSIDLWLDMIRTSIGYGIASGELRAEINKEVLSYLLLNTFTVTQKILYTEENETAEAHAKRLEEMLMVELDIILNGILNRR